MCVCVCGSWCTACMVHREVDMVCVYGSQRGGHGVCVCGSWFTACMVHREVDMVCVYGSQRGGHGVCMVHREVAMVCVCMWFMVHSLYGSQCSLTAVPELPTPHGAASQHVSDCLFTSQTTFCLIVFTSARQGWGGGGRGRAG